VPENNLPTQLTPLIGREREVALAREVLLRQDVRLLTFTGPGGVGKTRLALRVAKRLKEDFSGGLYLIRLAPIRDPDLVIPTIAQTLGLREAGERPLIERLKAYLRDKRLLLLLDNFEQVAQAGPLVVELLGTCPHLKVLVTSRATLHLSGEHVFPVPALELPDMERLPEDFQALSRYEAIEFFVSRVRAIKPSFGLTEATASTVAGICARLDGLPLAIELAAARVELLSPRALLARLEHRLQLLTGGTLDLPARQRTLRSTIAWSYDLLEEGECRLFRRLSVFVGGCTLHAAETIDDTAASPLMDTLNRVASLVDKNLLLQIEQDDGEPRFMMLETIREYALEQLRDRGKKRPSGTLKPPTSWTWRRRRSRSSPPHSSKHGWRDWRWSTTTCGAPFRGR
jgi:predicted ATPase